MYKIPVKYTKRKSNEFPRQVRATRLWHRNLGERDGSQETKQDAREAAPLNGKFSLMFLVPRNFNTLFKPAPRLSSLNVHGFR